MKKGKVIIALFLVFALTTQSTVLAAGIESAIMEIRTQQSIERLQANRQIYNRPTEFSGVLKSTDNRYALELKLPGENVIGYQPVGRLDIDLNDEQAVAEALQISALEDEVKAEIIERRDTVFMNGLTDVKMVVFSPDLLATNPEYFDYHGIRMKSEKTYVTNFPSHTERVSEGSQTKETASALANLTISILGVSSIPAVALTAGATSVLLAFVSLINASSADVVKPTTDDYMEAKINVDLVTQRTYSEVGGSWSLGLTAKQVKLNYIVIRQVYFKCQTDNEIRGYDKSFQTNFSNKVYKTNYFDSSSQWEIAFSFIGNPLELNITINVGSKKFIY